MVDYCRLFQSLFRVKPERQKNDEKKINESEFWVPTLRRDDKYHRVKEETHF